MLPPQTIVISHAGQISSGNFLECLRPMPWQESVLMCSPEYFDVVDVKNPFMENQSGKINRAEAQKQWDALMQCFRGDWIRGRSNPGGQRL